MMGEEGHLFFGGGFMWILWLLLLAGVVFLFMGMTRSDNKADKETPLEILKKRYARGEIDEEEYERRRNDLDKDK